MKEIDVSDINNYKSDLYSTVAKLHTLSKEIAHDELHRTIVELSDRIQDPFMFVIAGEVKAGKSSFINALLNTGREICKVAASPMTDTIQQIIYGETEREETINPFLKRIYIPEEKLKEIAIVDTPGTNTIVDHHQEITERFIPISDLIIFVFESKNPYRQSAWDFFDFIKNEWRKKIIFILQQKDLMTDADLTTNIAGVKEYAQKQGIQDAKVFAVSAKMELEGQHAESGYIPVRDFINKNITGGRAPFLKVLNLSETCGTINGKIYESVEIRQQQFDIDLKFRQEIKDVLDHQETKTKKQVDILVENLLATYDRISREKENEIGKGISFTTMLKKSFSAMLGWDKSPKDWLNELAKDFEYQLNTSLKDKLNDGVIDIADNIQDMGKIVDMKIKESTTVLKDNHDIFADIAERRANVLKDLQRAFSDFLKTSENFYDDEVLKNSGNIAPNLAAGGGIAAVGAIITMVSNAAVFDITGGILTAIGLTFAGITVGLQRKKILRRFQEEIAKGRKRLDVEVSEKLKEYTSKIKSRIDQNFNAFDKHLEAESAALNNFKETHLIIEKDLNLIKSKIEEKLSTI